MNPITRRDYEAVLDGMGRLHDCDGLKQFPLAALTEILRLVGADSGTFNYVAPTVPRVVTVARPEIPDEPERTRRFARYLPQHAALNHFLASGDPGACKLSDFQSVREYHALPLYQEFYREIGYEDQFTFMLFPPGAELIGISLARDRRSFTERDRKVLNLLRPQVGRAYRHVERMDRLLRALGRTTDAPTGTRVAAIPLGEEDRPLHYGAEAQRWISHFIPGRPRGTAGLPAEIDDWLRRSRRSITTGSPAVQHRFDALIRERDGERLRLVVHDHPPGRGRLLVLSVETLGTHALSQLGHTLTRREVEVLLQVEQGKSNGEAAAALGISPLTVRCHLEHIFDKLNVVSRTGAVTRFRQLAATVLNDP